MAKRGREPGRFYVYSIHDGDGFPVYVGKGLARRAKQQSKRFCRPFYIERRFSTEDGAFSFERRLISELSPELNVVAGGGGGRVTSKPARQPSWEREMDKVGIRRYVARALLRFDLQNHVAASKIDRIRQVANGPRC
jgi:hypothetical protein